MTDQGISRTHSRIISALLLAGIAVLFYIFRGE